MLEHTGEIKLALSNSSSILSSEGTSALNLIRELKLNIAKISQYLPDGENLLSRISSVYIELDDIATEIDRLASGTEADPERLNVVSSRLDILYTLMQKHRVQNIGELIARRRELEELVKSIVTSDEHLSALDAAIAKERASLMKMAEKISEKRVAVIPEVENRITELLKQLGMPNAKFRIDLKKLDEFTRTGMDCADFMFSANKQVPPENLARVASGGELSRVMLSLKSLLSRNKNLPTIIFDEIDSGVSGEVADKVGQILSEMGKHMQVINITHLPQVAAKGGEHYHVYKDDTKDSTITRIKLLSTDERVLEIARLLSGSEVTDTALKNAKELLKLK
jgi:DNA repair protein RecN (Recombination protein N)